MSFKLEDLPYQRQAIDAVVRLFEGQQRGYFDLDLQGDCFPNKLLLARKEIVSNVEKIIEENGIGHGEASLTLEPDYCVEMETGTGKTLVYLRTIYELSPEYGFTKFIILDAESLPESNFANEADRSPKVRALIKLPDWYKIPVSSLKGGSGHYTPDFGLVITDKGLRDEEEVELHLVVETKSTDRLEQLSAEEQIKIRCAIQHFQALGIATNTTLRYQAPVSRFDPKVKEPKGDYRATPDPMGFFAPKNSFGQTLQQATASTGES